MFFKKWSEERLLNRRIVSAVDIGDTIEGMDGQVYTPGFGLDNGFRVGIENNTILHGMNSYKDLVGLKILDIKFEIKNKLIKFFFENNKSIEVDMSDNGFNGPEAIIIEKGTEIMVISDIET
jgi:hypothetical protein